MKCCRTACPNEHQGCRHWLSRALYCEYCAILINRNNPQFPGLVFIPTANPGPEQKYTIRFYSDKGTYTVTVDAHGENQALGKAWYDLYMKSDPGQCRKYEFLN